MLTVDPGSASADSLVTLAEARAYALARGVTLSATDATLEADLHKAMDYLNGMESRLKGVRAFAGQALAFPRNGFWYAGEEWPGATIPTVAKYAQIALAMDLASGLDLNNPLMRDAVTEKTIHGAVTVRYAAGQRGAVRYASTALLAELTAGGGQARLARA